MTADTKRMLQEMWSAVMYKIQPELNENMKTRNFNWLLSPR